MKKKEAGQDYSFYKIHAISCFVECRMVRMPFLGSLLESCAKVYTAYACVQSRLLTVVS